MSSMRGSGNPPPKMAQKTIMLIVFGGVGIVVAVIGIGILWVIGKAAWNALGSNAGDNFTVISTKVVEVKRPGSSSAAAARVAADEFLNELRAGNLDTAYDKGSSDFRASKTRREFKDDVGSVGAFRGRANITLTPQLTKPERVVFKGTATGANGSASFTMDLSQDRDDEWKVDRFTIDP